MLAGRVRHDARAIRRLQMERADDIAFIDDTAHPERPPRVGERGRLHAFGCLRPVARHQRIGRKAFAAQRPAQGQRILAQHDTTRREAPQPFRALKRGDFG